MQRNNSDSYDGVFNIFTGADHISKMGEMDLWNYTSQTKYVLYENLMNEILQFFENTFSSAFVLKAFMNPIVEWSMDLLARLGHLVVIKQTFPCTSRISAGSCWFFTMSCRFVV